MKKNISFDTCHSVPYKFTININLMNDDKQYSSADDLEEYKRQIQKQFDDLLDKEPPELKKLINGERLPLQNKDNGEKQNLDTADNSENIKEQTNNKIGDNHIPSPKADDDLKQLLQYQPDMSKKNEGYLFLVGIIFTPITLAGSLLGYVRAYNRFMRPFGKRPVFHPILPVVKKAMIYGGIIVWGVLLALILIASLLYSVIGLSTGVIIAYLIGNIFATSVVFGAFKLWQTGVNNTIIAGHKFGTAQFARPDELDPYVARKGIYIGAGAAYSKQGHILTVAGSRSGKFTNLIAPNLLGWGDIDGSWVVIDPKGEIAAVTSDYQRSIGQNVVTLNPWNLLETNLGNGQRYNPLDILDASSPHFVDDCYLLAEMLVPIETGRNKFFSDSARAVISGLIMHIAVSQTDEKENGRTLKTLWKWVRYPQDMWDRNLSEMEAYNEKEPFAENMLNAAMEINKLASSGTNTWGSILSTIIQATDFLKSPALQTALQSGYDPKTLAYVNTTIYIIIPADKIQSHSRWMRLLVTSLMKAVVRNPNKKVCFILDEFASLGYLPEIETAIGAYAGFNITVWPILQSLVQLHNLYQNNWEIFIGSSAVRQFFGISNNFDAAYISKAIGKTSNVVTTRSWFGIKDASSNERDLITPDELRIESGVNMFMFIEDLYPFILSKWPYYEEETLAKRARPNPYVQIVENSNNPSTKP